MDIPPPPPGRLVYATCKCKWLPAPLLCDYCKKQQFTAVVGKADGGAYRTKALTAVPNKEQK